MFLNRGVGGAGRVKLRAYVTGPYHLDRIAGAFGCMADARQLLPQSILVGGWNGGRNQRDFICDWDWRRRVSRRYAGLLFVGPLWDYALSSPTMEIALTVACVAISVLAWGYIAGRITLQR